jgi:transposase
MRSSPSTASAANKSNPVGKAGREFLAAVPLRDAPRRRLDSLLSLIDDFDREITDTSMEIDKRAKADERVAVLCQIRGVGRYTAMLIIAEVGDVHRSPAPPSVCVGGTDPNGPQL